MGCPDEAEIVAYVFGPKLVAGGLEPHLADCDDCRRLAFALAGDALDARSSATSPRAASGSTAAPTRLGRFHIEDELGRGGMGHVYRARDPELGRTVAIKVKRALGYLDNDGDERLRREAHALARLNHPNVVTVYETGRDGAAVYVVMEYVDGPTLDHWLDLALRTPRQILDVLVAVASGLAAAHGAGLIHRDVKPGNIFVGSAGLAKIGDFGLARVDASELAAGSVEDVSAEWLQLSVSRSIIGTPAYMAPEQLTGAAVDERSDQFAFCVTALEALTRQRPFTGHSTQALFEAIAAGTRLTRPDGVRPRIWRALLRGVSPDPARRFPSMRALITEIAEVRSPVRWIVAGAAGLAVAAAVPLFTAQPSSQCAEPDDQARRVFASERADSIAGWLASTGQAAQAGSVTRLLNDYGARWQAASRSSCLATERGTQSAALLDRQRQCLARRRHRIADLEHLLPASSDPRAKLNALRALEAVPDPESCLTTDSEHAAREPPPAKLADAVAELERRIDHVLNVQSSGQAASVASEIEAVVRDARATEYPAVLARALIAQVKVDHALERYANLERLLDEAGRAAAASGDDLLVAEAWTRRVYALANSLGKVDEARRWYSAADAAVLGAGDPPNLRADLLMYSGMFSVTSGDYATARARFTESLAIHARRSPPSNLKIASSHNSLAITYMRAGDRREAESHFLQALALLRAAYGDLHPDTVSALNNLGSFLSREAPERARGYLEQARAAGEALLGPDSPTVAESLQSLGTVHSMLGDERGALDSYRRAYAIKQRTLSPEHPRVAEALGHVGKTLLALGETREAIAVHGEALVLLGKSLGPTDIAVNEARIELGDALCAAGDYPAAMAEYRTAIAGYEASGAADGEDAAAARVSLAGLLVHAGSVDTARRLLERARPVLAAGENHEQVVLAIANLVLADSLQARSPQPHLQELEREADAGKLPPEVTAYLDYARARACAGLGQAGRARDLAERSRLGFANSKHPPHREVTRWLRSRAAGARK